MATRDDRRDPHRTLDLLWDGQQQPARGPRPGLSLEQIVRTAVSVADADGLGAVSMRRVAEDLGFTTMSLYRYVPSKGDLLDLMVDAVSAALPTGSVPDGWRSGLARWAHESMAMYRLRPWVLEVPINGPPMGPNQVAWMEWALQCMWGSGLEADDMIGVLMLLTGYVGGHAKLTSTLSQAEARTGAGPSEWDSAYARMLERVAGDGTHPALAHIVTAGVFDPGDGDLTDEEWLDHDFEFGLERILDGVAAHIRSRRDG